jgi:glycosyltransferase involved in cell wall biosynthesis
MKNKILHIITSIDNGGAENHLKELVLNQVNNYSVFLIYFKGNNYHRQDLEKNGVKVFKITFVNKNIFLFILNFFKLVKIFKKINPEIVHCHLWLSEIYGILLKIFFTKKFKLVISKHLDSYIFEASFGRRKFFNGIFIEKIILKYSDHIIFISKSVKNYFFKNIYLKKKKFSIIHYGINIKNFKKFDLKLLSVLLKKYHISKNTKIIGCVARHVEQKKIDMLIKSYAKFSKDNPQIASKLIIIGRGKLTSNLKILARQLMISEKIIWVPYAKQINLYYQLFDVFCLTSEYEGFGLVLLEALSFGLPVVATKSGSIPEIIKNKKNGYLVMQNDINKFSQRIKDCLDLSELINFKKKQINFIKKNFLLNKVFLKTEKIYKLHIN